MGRRGLAAMAMGALGLVGCRPGTVTLGFEPDVGATYRYRYEVDIVLTRQVEGGDPQVSELRSTLTSDQTVLEVTPEGILVRVVLRSEDSAPTNAVVLLDRAGSLQAIEEIEGLPAEEIGLPSAGTVLASGAAEPPDRPLAPGDRWSVEGAGESAAGRVDRLGIIDGHDVAVVTASLVQAVQEVVLAGDSSVAVDGELRSVTSTTFDLADGAVRSGRLTSSGAVDLEISPPPGIVGTPVPATVGYELQVRTTRLR